MPASGGAPSRWRAERSAVRGAPNRPKPTISPSSTCHETTAAGLRVYPPNQSVSKAAPYPFPARSGAGPIIPDRAGGQVLYNRGRRGQLEPDRDTCREPAARLAGAPPWHYGTCPGNPANRCRRRRRRRRRPLCRPVRGARWWASHARFRHCWPSQRAIGRRAAWRPRWPPMTLPSAICATPSAPAEPVRGIRRARPLQRGPRDRARPRGARRAVRRRPAGPARARTGRRTLGPAA